MPLRQFNFFIGFRFASVGSYGFICKVQTTFAATINYIFIKFMYVYACMYEYPIDLYLFLYFVLFSVKPSSRSTNS